MAVLTFSQIQDIVFDRCQINTATDAPVSAAEFLRRVNSAYRTMWEIEGGSFKKVTSATAWTSAQSATGVVTGILTDIDEILHVFGSTTSGSTGFSTGDVELNRADYSEIMGLRQTVGYGSYTYPKLYSVMRLATVTPASVGLLQLDYWPSVTGYYLPTHYVPMLTPLDASVVTTPDLTDTGSEALALLAARQIAPLVGRAELVPAIDEDIQLVHPLLYERIQSAQLVGKQDE